MIFQFTHKKSVQTVHLNYDTDPDQGSNPEGVSAPNTVPFSVGTLVKIRSMFSTRKIIEVVSSVHGTCHPILTDSGL